MVTKVSFFILCLFLLAAAYHNAYTILDPDFGYRLRTGDMVLHGSFPQTDPYSYTMPDFPYVEHAWIVGAIWAGLYPFFSYAGVAAFQLIIAATAMLLLAARARKKAPSFDWHEYSLYILSGVILFRMFGVRAQIWSWAFFAALFYTFEKKSWHIWRAYVPLLFLLWANTHGSFVAGLLLLTVWISTHSFERRTFDVKDILILVTSWGITLGNPYGISLWREALDTMTDSRLRLYIDEWMPSVFSLSLAHIIYISFSGLWIGLSWKHIPLSAKILTIVTAIMSLSSARNIPIGVLWATPVSLFAWDTFKRNIRSIPHALSKLSFIGPYVYVFISIIVVQGIAHGIKDSKILTEHAAYPSSAIAFLQEQKPRGNIFAPFFWGGYMIHHYPQKKVFIDGRMTSWRFHDEYHKDIPTAFDMYRGILDGSVDYRPLFQKYDINTVLWQTPDTLPIQKTSSPVIISRLLSVFDIPTTPYSFIQELHKDGWKEVYKDPIATIYMKP